MKRLIVAVLTLFAAVTAVQFAGGAPREHRSRQDDPIVNRFLQRQDTPLFAYRAIRTMRAVNPRVHVSGEIEVETEFSVADGFQHRVIRESGSAIVRHRVLEAVLREEQAVWERRESDEAALSLRNYTFGIPEPVASAAPPEKTLFAIPIAAVRRDRLLVIGTMHVTADGDLRSVAGRLVRTPSWWTSRVDIVRQYARCGGVRVPVATRSTAQVKMIGRSEFEMTYRYESINGAPIPDAAGTSGPSGPCGPLDDAMTGSSQGESAPTPR